MATITVTGSDPAPDGYRKNTALISACDDASLLDTPLSISVITCARLMIRNRVF